MNSIVIVNEIWFDGEMRNILFVVLIVGVFLGVGVLAYVSYSGRTDNKNIDVDVKKGVEKSEESGVTESELELQGERKSFVVEGSNYKFEPNEIRVKKGDIVEITFSNSEGSHDFMIDEFEVATNILSVGDEESVEFIANKTGVFEYYCSISDHRQSGMVGKFIVE